MIRRAFNAPVDEERCDWTIALRGKSISDVGANDIARCMRRRAIGCNLCAQHLRMANKWSCPYCGGSDELPPDHCADCTRPQTKEKK